MKTLSVTISDKEYKSLGIKKDSLSYADFIDRINRKSAREALRACVKAAEKYGLSEMTMDEINEEINAVRNNAKNRH